MSERFTNPVSGWIIKAIAIAAAAWFSYAGVTHELAYHYGSSANPEDWVLASRIEPANPENWYRVGRYRHLDFDHADVPLAISYYRRAVELNPRSAYYKLDLASALEMSGNNVEADKYFKLAQENYPLSAEVSWKFGNFLLRQQRLSEAYVQIHRAVVVDPSLTPLAVSRAWHSNPDVRLLMNQVLPDTAAGDWEALSFLVQEQDSAAAIVIWNRLIARKPVFDWRKVNPLTDLLVRQERFDEAGAVWRQATASMGIAPSGADSGSLIFDGGFEKDLTGGGFGWHHDDVAGADFDFDTDEKHSGTRSARVTFDGNQNIYYQNLFQFVLVAPSTRYRFRAYLRTDRISTESGMRFEVIDGKRMSDLDVLTTNEIGTQPWTQDEAEFTTGPATHLVLVRLLRKQSTRLGNQLSGTVWVDDVSLVPVGTNP